MCVSAIKDVLRNVSLISDAIKSCRVYHRVSENDRDEQFAKEKTERK